MRSAPLAGVKIMLALTLVGCTTTGPTTAPPQPGTGAATPTATPAPPSATPGQSEPTPAGPGAATRVVLIRSGGYAGRGDTLTVEPDGRWTMVDRAGSRRTGRLDPVQLGRLHGLTADPGLAAEARQSPGPTDCADAFTYRLQVGGTETGYLDCPTDGDPRRVTRSVVELLLTVMD